MNRLARRLDKLEAGSKWGSKADLLATDVIFMRTPEGGDTDARVRLARQKAHDRDQSFWVTHSASGNLPMWQPVPIEVIPEDILEEAISAIRAQLAVALEQEAAAREQEQRT